MQAQALLFTASEQIELADIVIPDPGPGEVVVEVAYSTISPGTELRNLRYGERGQTWQAFIPGYAASGTIIACGPDTTHKVGMRVFCNGTKKANRHRRWGGHVSHALCLDMEVFAIPDHLPLLDAALAKQAAIAYHGVRMSHPYPHERVAVIGLGLIGQISARLHRLTGAQVVAADRSVARVEIARNAGISANPVHENIQQAFLPVFPDGVDVIVDATGLPAVLPEAILLAHTLPWDDTLTPGARYIVQGSYNDTVNIPYSEAFARELTFFLPRSDQPRDIRAVIQLMAAGTLPVRDLIGVVNAPADAAATYEALRQQSTLLTAAFAWNRSGNN